MSIEEIKNRHINKSWKVGCYSADYYKQGYKVLTEYDGVVAECIEESEEAEFIAHAPADIEFLLEQNQRLVEALERLDDRKHGMLPRSEMARIAKEVLQAYKLLEKKEG